jgi:hypothetical protein
VVTKKDDGTDVIQTYLYDYIWLCIMRTLIMEYEYPCYYELTHQASDGFSSLWSCVQKVRFHLCSSCF